MKLRIGFVAALAAFAAFGGTEDWDARYAAWQERVKAYAPDLSDSSKHLEPPAAGRLAQPIRIVENGRPKAEIVVDLSDAIRIDNFFTDKAKWTIALKMARGHEHEVARKAAQTLQKTLAEITGAELPVVQKATDEKNVKIYLGASFAKGRFDDDLKALASQDRVTDGFAVRVKDGAIYIFGARPAGTLFGVETFVENNTDLIWAFSGPGGAVYTKTPTLDVVWADAREIPMLFARGIGGGEPEAEWKMHNRINFTVEADCGGFENPGGHYFCPQYYDFSAGMQKFNSADKNGHRAVPWMEYYSKLCLSNPDLLKHQLESVPNLQTMRYGSPYLCVFGMDDNANVCQCEECRKPIQALDGRMLTPEKDGQVFWSAQFYQFLNKIDDAIQAKYPGYATSTFAYFYASCYPPVKVNKTIVPYFCTYWRGNYHLPVFAPKVRGWAKHYEDWIAHSSEITMYDYWGLALSGQPYAEIYQEDLKYQRAIGFLATGTEGFMGGDELGMADERWCMARLMWNVDDDVEQLHRRFNRRAYREAAPHFDKIRGLVRQAYYAANTEDLKKAIGTNETLKATVAAEIAAAEKAAVKNPLAKNLVVRSVNAWRAFYGLAAPAAPAVAGGNGKGGGFGAAFWTCSKDNKRKLARTETGATVMNVPFGSSVSLPKNADASILRFTIKVDEGVFETRGYPRIMVQDAGSRHAEECESYMRPGKDGAYLVDIRPPEGSNLASVQFGRPEGRRGAWQPPAEGFTIVKVETEFDDGTPLLADQLPKQMSADKLKKLQLEYKKAHRSTADIIKEVGAEAFVDDRWQSHAERLKVLGDLLRKRIAEEEGFTADAALAYLRAHLDDTVGRATGVSALMQGWDMRAAMPSFVRAFAAKGQKADALKFGLAWVKWDGEATPLDFQIERMNVLHGTLGADLPGWKEMIVRGTTEGSTSGVRGNCVLTLLNLDKANLSAPENQKRILALLMDEFMNNHVRLAAAKLLPDAFRKDGQTDAETVSKHLLAAYATGDWSNLARACYSHGFDNDLMLDALVATCERLEKEEQTDAAKKLFEAGVKALTYDLPVGKAIDREKPYYYGNPKPAGYEREVAASVKGRYGRVEKLRAKLYPASLDMEEDGDTIDLDE